MAGRVVAVNVSARKGVPKTPVPCVELRPDHGVVGDAHGAPGARQVSLLSAEAIEQALGQDPVEAAGKFAENITVGELPAEAYDVGTRLRVGLDVVLEISQIGKECHTKCAIYRQVGDCIMPRQGVFAMVVEGGTVAVGDAVEVVR
ncbi:MAG: MOSC domain-containing protein [Myxococcota bacterium]|nr:MOSC domain-containing protein [Myxococcota bacterium]